MMVVIRWQAVGVQNMFSVVRSYIGLLGQCGCSGYLAILNMVSHFVTLICSRKPSLVDSHVDLRFVLWCKRLCNFYDAFIGLPF